MIIQKIDYKGNNILRAYKNGVIIWSPFSLLYFDIGQTTIPLTYFAPLSSSYSPYLKEMLAKTVIYRNVKVNSSKTGIGVEDLDIVASDLIKIQSNNSEALDLNEKIEIKDFNFLASSNAPNAFFKDQIKQSAYDRIIFESDKSGIQYIDQKIKEFGSIFFQSSLSKQIKFLEKIKETDEQCLVNPLSKLMNNKKVLIEHFFIKNNLSPSKIQIMEQWIQGTLNNHLNLSSSKEIQHNSVVKNFKNNYLQIRPSDILYISENLKNSLYSSFKIDSSIVFSTDFYINWMISSWIELFPIVSKYGFINIAIELFKNLNLRIDASATPYILNEINVLRNNQLRASFSKGIKREIILKINKISYINSTKTNVLNNFNKVKIDLRNYVINNSLSISMSFINIIEGLEEYFTFISSQTQRFYQEHKIFFNNNSFIFNSSEVKKIYVANEVLNYKETKLFNVESVISILLKRILEKYLIIFQGSQVLNFIIFKNIKTLWLTKYRVARSSKIQAQTSKINIKLFERIIMGIKKQIHVYLPILKIRNLFGLSVDITKILFSNIEISLFFINDLGLSTDLVSLFLTSKDRTSIFSQIFLHELLSGRLSEKLTDNINIILEFFKVNSNFKYKIKKKINNTVYLNSAQQLKNSVEIKQKYYYNLLLGDKKEVMGEIFFIHNLLGKLSLGAFNFLSHFSAYNKSFLFSTIGNTKLVKDFAFLIDDEKILVYSNLQKDFYKQVGLKENIGEKIYSSLILNTGSEFKWRYPKWNSEIIEERNNLYIEQVFDFSYKTGEIR